MPLVAQLAKLLTKGAQKLMSPEPGAIMKHEPTLRVLTPEEEAESFATIPQSSYGLLQKDPAPITPVETPVDQLPIAEMDVVPPVREEMDVVPPVREEMDELVPSQPQRSALRQQVEDLGLSKEEADEVLIPDAIDINQMPEVWKAPYRKAQEQGYSVPLFHFTRAGEEIQFDPKGEGTGYLNPLLLKEAEGKDIGIHLGTLSAMGKQNEMLGKPEAKVMGVTLRKQKEEQQGQAMLPLVTKLDNVAIVPDMGRFKLPSKWLEELSNIDVERNPKKTIRHLLRKDNLEKDFKKNKDIIKNTLDPSIETVDDLKKYVKENGDFIFWPEDGKFVYLKNEVKLSKLDNFIAKVSRMEGAKFDPLKGMSPTLWKQLMEAAHTFHMKNIFRNTKQLDPESDMFIPEKIHPSLIDGWFKALWKILEDNGYDAFAYPNFVEDYGAFSYMFLDPKKVKSIFAKEFDPESFSFGKKAGGVVDMRNGGKVGAAVVAASLMASGGQAMDMRDGGVVGMEDGGWLKETSKIASKVGDVLSDVVDDPSKWLKAGVGELFDREQLSGQPLLSSYDLPHAELGKLSEQTLPQKYFGDINRYREIWSMYHGSDPSLEKEIQFVMHQNIKGKAPKQKEIDRITNEIVLDFKGDRGTDPKAPEINTDILAEALRRIAYHETYGGKVKRQAEKGPARGWWQVEPKTAYNMLKGKKGVGEAEDQNFLGPKVRKRLLKQTGLSLKQINKLGRDEFNKLLENNQGFNATVAALNVLTKASQRGKLNLLY